MYAYVKYLDGEKSILPVSLIKKFKPASVDDLDPSVVKLAYWRSETGEGENYYAANVLMLANTKNGLIKKMQDAHLAIPVIIERAETRPESGTDVPKKHKRSTTTVPHIGKGKGPQLILPKEETAPINNQLLEENAALRAELVVLQGEILAERRLTRRLQDALLNKIDLLTSHPAVLSEVEVVQEAPCSSAAYIEATQADDSALPASAVPGAPVSAEPPFQAPEQATDGLPAQGEPDAHLGDAAEVEELLEPEDMETLMSATTDSMFVRDISRTIWGEQLKNRSLTGAPSRRFLKSGAVGKRALTPRKVKYVRRALAAYIKAHPSPVVSPSMRLSQLNTHVRSLLIDENRKRP